MSYNILDSETDVNFDEITNLAASICRLPISLVSLVDEKRQWFKSCYGLDAKETSRDISFCTYAIEQSEIFEIPDARKDERFADNPLVKGELNIVFYAGVPLKSSGGYNLGTLCVIGHEPKKMTEIEKESLRVLAKQVVAQMELIKNNTSLKNLNKEITTLSKKIKDQSLQIANVSKMASLGVLASGVTHEITNPLTIISMITVGVRSAIPNISHEKLAEKMEQIDSLVARAGKITRGLELFSRDSSDDPLKREKINDLIQSTLDVFANQIESNGVRLLVELSQNNEILCRAGEVSQSLLSLLSNALDALKNECSDPWIKVSVSETSKTIILSVSNSGPCIDVGSIDKIMDPFYTTKNDKERAGLGLSTAYNIMKLHHGNLRVDRDSKNTKFDMIFPK